MQIGNFFEDFSLNQQIIHSLVRTVTQADVSIYLSLFGSRFPIHYSQKRAEKLGIKLCPLEDMLAFHIGFGLSVNDISLNAIANLGYAQLLFYKNVFVGDELSTQSEIVGLKENSNGKSGIVYVHTQVFANDKLAISWYRWVMVKKKNSQLNNIVQVPNLAKEVKPHQLVLEDYNWQNYQTDWTGCAKVFKDFNIGNKINHTNGITVDNTQHTMATNLYQNNAQVHFNKHMMAKNNSNRLVYGGHILSITRSLAFYGLANLVAIKAFNAGSHTNPVFSGDTIYAQSEIIDKYEWENQNFIAAIRIKSVAMKNIQVNELEYISQTNEQEKKVYHPNIVLDWDYWALIIK